MTLESSNPTIVVGYDGSPAARAAVDHAIDRAGPHGRLVLVHAYTVPLDYAGATYYLKVQNDVPSGPAAFAITRAAEVHDADEIVIGSRGVGRVRALLGSVAYDVIHRAHCPVTVIPERMVETQTGAAGDRVPGGLIMAARK